jgi:hypothetical protein
MNANSLAYRCRVLTGRPAWRSTTAGSAPAISLARLPLAGAGHLSFYRDGRAVIRRLVVVALAALLLVVAAFVGMSAYQALRAPHVSNNIELTPENCSPGPCVDVKGFTLWISDVKVDGNLVSMKVSFKNSSTSTHASPEDLQLIDASRHSSIPLTEDISGCKTWIRQDFSKGATFGPINVCFRVSNVTRPFVLHWTPDLGPFCCETNVRIP